MNKTPLPRLIAAATLVIISFNQAIAQKKVFAGYYITLNGDNVKGIFPGYTQWNKNPAQVDFIAAGETKHTILTPQNTRSFVVEGYDEYVSYTGNRLVNPIDKNILITEMTFASRNDLIENVTAFLRLVTTAADGDLYVLNDAKRINFFYKTPGQQITELRYKEALDHAQMIDMPEYKQQLNNVFAEVIEQKKLDDQLEQLTYTEEGLSSFFRAMFPTATTQSQLVEHARWIGSVGAVVNTVTIESDPSVIALHKTYQSTVSPMLSIGYYLPLGRDFGKYFLYQQLKLYRYQNIVSATQDTTTVAITYQSNLVGVLEASAGCNFVNHENFKCFIAAGIGILLQPGATEIQKFYRTSDHALLGTDLPLTAHTIFYSADVSAGVTLNKKMQLSVTYKLPSRIDDYVFFTPNLSTVGLTVGYMF